MTSATTKQSNLLAAKAAKKDEFYTQLSDVENEMRHYKDHFKGKIVYCNCDDPRESAFFKYFSLNFEHLGLKRLIASCYKSQSLDLFSKKDSERAIWIAYDGDKDGDRIPSVDEMTIHEFEGDGDFRSTESIALLEMADIVVTNPPFSLFREYIAQLIKYKKMFLIVGHLHAFVYKEVWPLFKDGKIWMGCNGTGNDKWFHVPDGYPKRKGRWAIDKDGRQMSSMGNVCWYTNLSHSKRKDAPPFYKKYVGNEKYYPNYTNEDAIECSKVKDIPCDFYGMIGVPITYIEKHNPDEFELVRLFQNAKIGDVSKYTRILIKRRR